MRGPKMGWRGDATGYPEGSTTAFSIVMSCP